MGIFSKKYDVVKRGEVYMCDLGYANLPGSEQRGLRPCVIIQNDVGNRYSTTTIVACITSQDKKNIPTHVKISKEDYSFLCTDSVVLCEQLKTIDKVRLEEYIGEIDVEILDKQLMISMGLSKYYNEEVEKVC